MARLPEFKVRLMVKEDLGLYSAGSISSPEDAVKLLAEELGELDVEQMYVLNLDVKNKPISYHIVSIGDISGTVCAMRSVFKTAILANASNIMLFHNHPSGDVTPSAEDEEVTRRAREAGKILGIKVLDHIIVGAGSREMYSFTAGEKIA